MLKRILAGFIGVVGLLVVGAIFAIWMFSGPYHMGLAADRNGDHAEAAGLYRQAAEQGHAKAQYNLGHMYINGHGVPQDYSEAAKWYRLAADQGDLRAMTALGFMYTNGDGLLQDYSEAAKWYELAAQQGYADAQNNLGLLYKNGQGVPQDYVAAHMWFNLAAAQGSEDAIQNRDSVIRRMSSDQIAEAQRLARDWKPTE